MACTKRVIILSTISDIATIRNRNKIKFISELSLDDSLISNPVGRDVGLK